YRPGDHPALPSFPTRRSSDLDENIAAQILQQGFSITYDAVRAELDSIISGKAAPRSGPAEEGGSGGGSRSRRERQNMPAEKSKRSEEHTSELQSRENLVCRLL